MQELENIQPEESQEGSDARDVAENGEAVEEQALEEATIEPGARVEEEQSYEQAEAVEGVLSEAMSSTEQAENIPLPLPIEQTEEDTPEERGSLPIPTLEPAVEEPLSEALSTTEEVEATPIPLPIEQPVAEVSDEQRGAITLPPPEQAVQESPGGEVGESVLAEEVLETLSEEQKTALDGLDPTDKEALLRVIGQSGQILPDNVPGHSGGLIY